MASPKELSGPGGNTVIGPSILISGKLSGDEDLTVRGRVEGELALTRTLIVEPSGVVKANVSVKNAVVSGVVVGNIAATESVELTRDGRMVGDIRSPRVIIVDGASFRGRVDMGELAPGRPLPDRPRTQTRPALRAALAPARPPALPPRPPVRAAMPSFVSSRAAEGAKPPPAPPPAPPTVAAGAKKKVFVKKKR
jgi:cytoskeletal protein CcmA (bactofilin family)